MAYESIFHRSQTKESDKWMFGVFMWEVMNDCVTPWSSITNPTVVEKIRKNETLPYKAQRHD